MYNIRIVKFKLRRGTNSQRVQSIFKSGELIYTSDIKRCFAGDGVTPGGIPLSNINSISTTFPTFTAVGDYVFNTSTLRTYICTLTGFEYIGPYPDTNTINFSANKLQVEPFSITRDRIFYSIVALSGAILFNNVDGMSISYDDTTFSIDNNSKLHANIDSATIAINETSHLNVADLTLSNATQRTYAGILTADGTFLVMNINGTRQGIQLWIPPLIDIEPPGPPPPPVPPADTEFILAEDLSPIISNDGDNIVWTTAFRNYLITESGEYIMTEETDDILWDV